jgi:hypothetical protein
MFRPPHSPCFDLPNNICGGVQNMKLLIVLGKLNKKESCTDNPQTNNLQPDN